MKKYLSFILSVTIFTVCLLFPASAYAAESIPANGEWQVEYEIDDSAVTASGGNAIISLFVTNTSSTNSIYYASVDLGAGRDSHFYQNDPLIDFNPGLSQTLIYTVPISASDVGVNMNMWVGMSQGGATDTDGIGIVQVVIGEGPRYDASFDFNLSSTEVDAGETVTATARTVNNGNRDTLIKVYNISGGKIGEYVLHPGSGIDFDESIVVNSTRDFQYSAEVYNADGSVLQDEIIALVQTVAVRAPATPTPTNEPTPSPTQAPTPTTSDTPEITPTMTPDITPTVTPDKELISAQVSATPISEQDVSSNVQETKKKKSNIGLYLVIIVLIIMIIAIAGILLILIFRNKKIDAEEK